VLTDPAWAAVPGLRHGFLDARECQSLSWETTLTSVGVRLPLVLPRQVHGTRVVEADRAAPPPEADGLSTTAPGLLVGVVTADCMPVLLLDERRRVASAVHAGWRGAAAGVLEAALRQLRERYGSEPTEVVAAIGPAIGGCCYEVGDEVRAAFQARTGDVTRAAWNGRRHVDLRTAAAALLAADGVERVAVLGPCTACGRGYHSYRRDGAGTGRQLGFIGWA